MQVRILPGDDALQRLCAEETLYLAVCIDSI